MNARRIHRLAVMLLAVSAMGIVSVSRADTKRVKLEVPFRRPGFGMGGGSATAIIFGPEADRRVNTCAILQAVTDVSAAFKQVPADGLEGKQTYTTDFAKLTADALTEYNQSNSNLQLQSGYLYGVTYEISYEVQKDSLVYQVKSKLYYTGRDSAKWYDYSKKYNDTFFSKKLLAGIQHQVTDCAKK